MLRRKIVARLSCHSPKSCAPTVEKTKRTGEASGVIPVCGNSYNMTKAELTGYRREAKKHVGTHRSASIILTLCDEVERLTAIADERSNRYGDYTLLPFGAYKGKRLCDVPDDYLKWWFNATNEAVVRIDTEFGKFPERAAAKQKLKLLEYLKGRFNGNKET